MYYVVKTFHASGRKHRKGEPYNGSLSGTFAKMGFLKEKLTHETKVIKPEETKEQPKVYVCEICEREFTTPQGKAAHMRSH